MSITLTTYPSDIQSSGTPVIFRVTSNSTDPTTEIQCKVYYRKNEGEFFKLAATKQRPKERGKNYFEFNVSSVLEALMESELFTGSTGLFTNIATPAIEYSLYFAEYYPSTLFALHDVLTTGFFYMCNTKLYHTETQSIGTGTDWYMYNVGTYKFLTDSPSIQYIRSGERIQFGFLTSFADPTIIVRETKKNLTTASVEYELPDTYYTRYLWDWTVDADNVVTFLPEYPSQTNAYKIAESGTVGLSYQEDVNGDMWGGLTLTSNNAYYDFDLPNGLASVNIDISHRATGVDTTFEVWYEIAGVWTVSTIGTVPSLVAAFGLFEQTMNFTTPSSITSLRIKKTSANGVLTIQYVIMEYQDDNVRNKRCVFSLDDTHIDSDTKQLEIWAKQSTGGGVISETKTLVVDTEPYYQDTTRFAVKNKRGDFDFFTYTQLHSEVLSVEKSKVTKSLPNTFTTADRGKDVIKVSSEKVFSCVSRYIEEDELRWWATIIESDEVYVIENDTPISVDILTDSVPSYAPDTLIQLKIDWTYSVKR